MNFFTLRKLAIAQILCAFLFLSSGAVFAETPSTSNSEAPIRVAVVGLVHGHVAGFLPELQNHPEIKLVGIEEPDRALASKYEKQFHLDSRLFYTQIEPMIERTH